MLYRRLHLIDLDIENLCTLYLQNQGAERRPDALPGSSLSAMPDREDPRPTDDDTLPQL